MYERVRCGKEGKQHSSAMCAVCRQGEAIQALVCSGWGRDVSLNDREESAEAAPGVRPRSWSCKGGCGGHPFKQASRRTFQGQTVRQPNQSPAPPAAPGLPLSCISSPCRNTIDCRNVFLDQLAAKGSVEQPSWESAGHYLRTYNRPTLLLLLLRVIVNCHFHLSLAVDSCPSARETSTRMLEQGCLSPSAPSKSSRISTIQLDALPDSTRALPQQAWSAGRIGGILYTEARLKPSCVHVDLFLQRRLSSAQAGAEGCSQVESSPTLPWCE